SARIPADRLKVSSWIRRNPYVLPRRGDHQRSDPPELLRAADGSALFVDVAKRRAMSGSPDAGTCIGRVVKPRGHGGVPGGRTARTALTARQCGNLSRFPRRTASHAMPRVRFT